MRSRGIATVLVITVLWQITKTHQYSRKSQSTRAKLVGIKFVVSVKHALFQKPDVLYATAFQRPFLAPNPFRHQSQSCSLGMHLLLVEDVGQVAATAVLAVLHGSHEDTSAALRKESASVRCDWVMDVCLPRRRGTRVEVAQSCRQSRPCST